MSIGQRQKWYAACENLGANPLFMHAFIFRVHRVIFNDIAQLLCSRAALESYVTVLARLLSTFQMAYNLKPDSTLVLEQQYVWLMDDINLVDVSMSNLNDSVSKCRFDNEKDVARPA